MYSCQKPSSLDHVKNCMYVTRIPGIWFLKNLGEITETQKTGDCQIRHGNRGFWDEMILRKCSKYHRILNHRNPYEIKAKLSR